MESIGNYEYARELRGKEMFHRTLRTIQRTYKENKINSII